MFDLTNRESFEKLGAWIETFRNIRGESPICLIGNKADLKNLIAVSEEEASKLAKENGMDLTITSAKTGENVEKSFENLIKKVLDTMTVSE